MLLHEVAMITTANEKENSLMTNPLVFQILEYLRIQKSTCSLVDLVKFCEQDFHSLIEQNVDYQVVIFQKNFFVMNALYQIQHDISEEGFQLVISPLEVYLTPIIAKGEGGISVRDNKLADYYLNWSNYHHTSKAEIEALFDHFWKKYRALDKVDAARVTLEVNKTASWAEIRKAYQKKVICNHPDKGGCAEDFIVIRKAYEILSVSYNQ